MMNKKNIKGLTLIEILIGVAITALMMGAMFASYSVVNNSYNQVTDKAKVSRSSRDIVGMIIRDIRLAGFKYYYGANDEGIEQFHDLEHISGSESDRTVNDSHDPIIVFKDTLGYSTADNTDGTSETPQDTKIILISVVTKSELFMEILLKQMIRNIKNTD